MGTFDFPFPQAQYYAATIERVPESDRRCGCGCDRSGSQVTIESIGLLHDSILHLLFISVPFATILNLLRQGVFTRNYLNLEGGIVRGVVFMLC